MFIEISGYLPHSKSFGNTLVNLDNILDIFEAEFLSDSDKKSLDESYDFFKKKTIITFWDKNSYILVNCDYEVLKKKLVELGLL